MSKRHFGTKRFSLFNMPVSPVADTAVCTPDCARCQNSTVTLAHARRGLIIIKVYNNKYYYILIMLAPSDMHSILPGLYIISVVQERNRGCPLVHVTVNKPETSAYRAPTFLSLLSCHMYGG